MLQSVCIIQEPIDRLKEQLFSLRQKTNPWLPIPNKRMQSLHVLIVESHKYKESTGCETLLWDALNTRSQVDCVTSNSKVTAQKVSILNSHI